MGATGSGSFENDTATDWAAEVGSVEDVRKPFARLKRETDAHGEGDLMIEADFACELLAAAECVAMMLGRPSHDIPSDLAQRLKDAGEPDNLLFHQARNAALHVMRNSELAELWEETAQERGTNSWLSVLTNLIARLNPDVAEEVDPWAPEPAPSEHAPTDVVGACAFCNGPIERQHLWGMSVYEASDTIGLSKKDMWVHLPCLNARTHHKHAVAHLKFDPNKMPDLDQL